MALLAEQASDGWLGLPGYPISINNYYLGRLMPATPRAGNNVHGQEAASGACRWWYFVISQALLSASVFPPPVKNSFPDRWLIFHMLKCVSRRKEEESRECSVLCDPLHAMGLYPIQRGAAQPFSLALPPAIKIIWKPGTFTGQPFLSSPSLFSYFWMLLHVQGFPYFWESEITWVLAPLVNQKGRLGRLTSLPRKGSCSWSCWIFAPCNVA